MTGREPTQTKTLRNEYRVRLSKPFRALKGAIRTSLVDNDALGLGRDSKAGTGRVFAAADDITPSRGFAFTTDAEAQDAFLEWLETQVDRGILETTTRTRIRNGEHFTARYVQSAYRRGSEFGVRELRRRGTDIIPEEFDRVQEAVFQPLDQDTLERLYARNYADLKTVTDGMQTGVRRELATGLAQGWGPRKTASALNDRVDKLGITNAERLARTEMLNVHNRASKKRYSEAGIKKVEVLGTNPCPKICAPIIANNPYPIDEVPRGGPPFHPNCLGTTVPATDSSGNIIRASATDVARTAA